MTAERAHEVKNKTSAREYILLAEDDVDDVEFLTDSLQNLDQSLEVLVISSGDKAIPFFDQVPDDHLPGLIIMDYNLPAMSGYQILTILAGNERYKNIPKIIWSTSNSSFFEKECLTNGATAYFVKPADLSGYEELAEKILDFLKSREWKTED
ncbi:MAG TPA: response regulator [Puia sp.]|jgi:CheY-like chemotaxis protein